MSHQKSRNEKSHSHSVHSHTNRTEHDNQTYTEKTENSSSRRSHNSTSMTNSDINSINSSSNHTDDGRSYRSSNHSKNNENSSSKSSDNSSYNASKRDDYDKRSHNDKNSNNNKNLSKSSRSKNSDHSNRHSESRSSKHIDKNVDNDSRNIESLHKRYSSHQSGESKTDESRHRSHSESNAMESSTSSDHKTDRSKSSRDSVDPGSHSQKNLRSNHVSHSSHDKGRSKTSSSDGNLKSGSANSIKKSSSSHKTFDSNSKKSVQDSSYTSSSSKNDRKTGGGDNNEENSTIDTHKISKLNLNDNSNDSNNNSRNDNSDNSSKSNSSKSNSKSSTKPYNSAEKYHYKSNANSDISSSPSIARTPSKSASVQPSVVRNLNPDEKCDKDGIDKMKQSLYAMRGKSLSCLKEHFSDILNDSNDHELGFRPFARRADVQKLDVKDYGLYGIFPSEPLPMVLCVHCNHVMAPEGVARHVNRCHDARSKILHPSNLVASKQMPSMNFNKMKASLLDYEGIMNTEDVAATNKFNTKTSLQDDRAIPSKDDEFISSSGILLDLDSDMAGSPSSSYINTEALPIATSDLPDASGSTTSVSSSSDGSDSSTNIATTLTSLAINAKKTMLTFPKLLGIKDRDYDPNLHCGVIEESKHCKEDLKCTRHSIEAKKQVEGRSKPFEQILKEYSDKQKTVRVQETSSQKRHTASAERTIDLSSASSSDNERRSTLSSQSNKDSKNKKHYAEKHQDEAPKQKHDQSNRHETKKKSSKEHLKDTQRQDEQVKKDKDKEKNQQSKEERREREKQERHEKRKDQRQTDDTRTENREYSEKQEQPKTSKHKQEHKQKDDLEHQSQKEHKVKHDREGSLKRDQISHSTPLAQDNEKDRKKHHSSKKEQKDQKQRSDRQGKRTEEHPNEWQEPRGLGRKEEPIHEKHHKPEVKYSKQKQEAATKKFQIPQKESKPFVPREDDEELENKQDNHSSEDETIDSSSTTSSSYNRSSSVSLKLPSGKQLSIESADDFAIGGSAKSASYQNIHNISINGDANSTQSSNINVDSLHMSQFNELINDDNGDCLDMSFWEDFENFTYDTDILPGNVQQQENQSGKRANDSMSEDLDYNAEQKRRRITESMLANLAGELNGYDSVSLDTISEHEDKQSGRRSDTSEIYSQSEKLKDKPDHSMSLSESMKMESFLNSKGGLPSLISQERLSGLQSGDIIDITGEKVVTIKSDKTEKLQASDMKKKADDDDVGLTKSPPTPQKVKVQISNDAHISAGPLNMELGETERKEPKTSKLTNLPLAVMKLSEEKDVGINDLLKVTKCLSEKDHILTLGKSKPPDAFDLTTGNNTPHISSLPVSANENYLLSIIQKYKAGKHTRKSKLSLRAKSLSSVPKKVTFMNQKAAASLNQNKPSPSVGPKNTTAISVQSKGIQQDSIQARRSTLLIANENEYNLHGKENSLGYQNDDLYSQRLSSKNFFSNSPKPITAVTFGMAKGKGTCQFKRAMDCTKKTQLQIYHGLQSQQHNGGIISNVFGAGNLFALRRNGSIVRMAPAITTNYLSSGLIGSTTTTSQTVQATGVLNKVTSNGVTSLSLPYSLQVRAPPNRPGQIKGTTTIVTNGASATTSNDNSANVQGQNTVRRSMYANLQLITPRSDLGSTISLDQSFPIIPMIQRVHTRTLFRPGTGPAFIQPDKLLQKIPKALRKKIRNGATIKPHSKRSSSLSDNGSSITMPPKYKCKSLSSISSSIKNNTKKSQSKEKQASSTPSPLSLPSQTQKHAKLNGEAHNGETANSQGGLIRNNTEPITATFTPRIPQNSTVINVTPNVHSTQPHQRTLVSNHRT